jgi:hypothetical protein
MLPPPAQNPTAPIRSATTLLCFLQIVDGGHHVLVTFTLYGATVCLAARVVVCEGLGPALAGEQVDAKRDEACLGHSAGDVADVFRESSIFVDNEHSRLWSGLYPGEARVARAETAAERRAALALARPGRGS